MTLGVAIVGCGHMGKVHARAFLETGCCTLTWYCDIDEKKAVWMGVEVPTPGAMSTTHFSHVLSDSVTNVLSIASYDNVHGEQVLKGLEAGKHVFCEKPLAYSWEQLQAIKEKWIASGGKLACNLVLRTAPAYQYLKRLIDGGVLGEIYSWEASYLWGRKHKLLDGWRRDIDGYSAILGAGVHLVDLLLWATGQRPVGVAACGNKIATRDAIFRYQDFVSASFFFPSGMIGQINVHLGGVHPHKHLVRVYGTKGTFTVDNGGVWLETESARVFPGGTVDRELLSESPLPPSEGVLIHDFVKAILEGGDRISGRTRLDFNVTACGLAADEALASGRKVSVRYV